MTKIRHTHMTLMTSSHQTDQKRKILLEKLHCWHMDWQNITLAWFNEIHARWQLSRTLDKSTPKRHKRQSHGNSDTKVFKLVRNDLFNSWRNWNINVSPGNTLAVQSIPWVYRKNTHRNCAILAKTTHFHPRKLESPLTVRIPQLRQRWPEQQKLC